MRSVILFEEKNQNKNYLSTLDRLNSQLEERKGEIELIGLNSDSIKNCKGCFGCWIKTPGECVIEDYGNTITGHIINSDYCFALTSIRFGSYSYVIKQVIDRLIPMILPFFQFIDGEVHHQPRYKKYPNFIPIGFLSSYNQTEEELFKKITARNRINFFSPQGNYPVISDRDTEETIKEKISNTLN